MALEHLVGTLTREADAEATAILAAAEAETAAVRARSAGTNASRREASQTARQEQRRAAVEAALTAARRTARGELLSARRRQVDRVFASARALLPGLLDQSRYRAALARDVETALRCLGERPAVLRCHPAIHDMVEPLGRGRPGVKVEADPAAGSGFRLISDDGSLEIDGTLEDRLTRLGPQLALDVAAQLDGRP